MRPRVLPAAQGMAESQDSSVAALNVILSDTSESEYRSGDDDSISGDQDCGVVASMIRTVVRLIMKVGAPQRQLYRFEVF